MSDVEAPATPAAPAAAPSAPTATPAVPVNDGQKTAATTAPAPTDGEAKPDPKPADTPESRDNAGRDRRKMSRLYREAAEARAEANLLRKQMEEYKPKAPDTGAPRLEDFKDIEAYAEAKAKHESEKVLKDHTTKQQNETQKQAEARLVESWNEKVERADGKFDDWDEVVGDLKPTHPWSLAIMNAENGDDIAYHLGKDMKEAKRITALPPILQIFEIGRLSAKLLADPPVKPQTPSQAPAPIAPLSGTTPAESFSVSDTRDIGKWMKGRNAQKHGARR